MSATERIQKLLTASPTMLAKIDKVLDGEDTTTSNHETDTRLCTITEAAKRLALSRPSVYRLIKANRLKTVKLNGVSRITLESVRQFANG